MSPPTPPRPSAHRPGPFSTVALSAFLLAAFLTASCGSALVVVGASNGGSSGSSSPPATHSTNGAPSVSAVVVPAGTSTGDVATDFTLTDPESDPCDVAVEWRDVGAAGAFAPATLVAGPLVGLASSPTGLPVSFDWDSAADLGALATTVELRLTPDDGTDTGAAVVSATFAVDNTAPSTATVEGAAFAASPDRRRGVPLEFEVDGADRVVFQWRTAAGTFPALPADPGDLDVLLADPAQRRAAQIASELVLEVGGTLAAAASTSADLLGLDAGEASGLLAGGLTGRELAVRRAGRAPAPAAAGWAANPLSAPAGLLPLAGGERALVLDSAAPGTWRLRELDLATGTVARDLATGSDGDPDALARSHDGAHALVAVDAAGTWALHRVALADGASELLFTTAGATALGTVAGLLAESAGTTLLTVDDALVRVSHDPLASTSEQVVRGGLSAPHGLVPGGGAGVVLCAERDWVDPGTMTVTGRVARLDLARGELSTWRAAGLPRPTALARDGEQLLVLCDDAVMDGTRELRAAVGRTGTVALLAAGIADTARGLVADEGFVGLALGATDDLALGGGVEQRRAITAYDPALRRVTVDPAFDPVPESGRAWTVAASSSALLSAADPALRDRFVWDSRDAARGGDVVLRCVPYSAGIGVPADTGARAVDAELDVEPAALGGAGQTDEPRALATADFNGDGLPDLACANTAGDSVTLFFQQADGAYPAAPDRTLTGVAGALLDEPVALVALDADADGDADLVVASRASGDLTVLRQSSPGIFQVVTPSFGAGLTQAAGLVAAELSGDGLVDLAVADAGASEVRLFFQLPGGLFGAAPDAVVGGPGTTPGVRDVLADADFTGDGLRDLVCALGDDTLALFQQTAPGTFPAMPDLVLGGAGTTAGPARLAAADWTGDGALDLAVALDTGAGVALFEQQAVGLPAMPDATLTSADLADVQALALEDVDGDALLDVVAVGGTGRAAVFFGRADGGFEAEALVLGSDMETGGPVAVLARDLDGDGQVELVTANAGGDDLALFRAAPAPSFGALPDLELGGPAATAGVSALASADLDGDGDLDLVSADTTAGTLSLLTQASPAVFDAPVPLATMGQLTGPASVAAADLNGDGRVDLVCADAAGGALVVWYQGAGGTFTDDPDDVLGMGLLGAPARVIAADLDDDGRADLVSANPGAANLTVFLQQPGGGFPATPDLTLGGLGQTNGVRDVAAGDLNGDGQVDLACASETLDRVNVFFRTAPGTYPAAPDLALGGPGTSDGPVALDVADLDGDGDLDLAVALRDDDGVGLFLQSAPGVFPAAPDELLQGAGLQDPVSVRARDVDGDGAADVVAGFETPGAAAYFRQTAPGAFTAPARVLGAGGGGSVPATLLVLDLDGDFDRDVLLADPGSSTLKVFFGAH